LKKSAENMVEMVRREVRGSGAENGENVRKKVWKKVRKKMRRKVRRKVQRICVCVCVYVSPDNNRDIATFSLGAVKTPVGV